MFLDGALTFNTAVGTPQVITTTADSSVIDVTGAGVGTSPAMINGFPATNTAMANDYGLGDGVAIPHVVVNVTTAGVGAGTIQISVKAAPDSGTYTEGSYTTLVQTPTIVFSTLALGDIISIPLPPTRYTVGEAGPRFYKLTYTVSGSTGVSVLANLVLNPESATAGGILYNNNYAVI